MRKSIYTAIIVIIVLCFSLQVNHAQEIPAPPHAYSATDINAARDQVKRVRWTEGVIDTQISPTPQDPYKSLWRDSVKAAIFGGEDLMNRALDHIEQTLSDWQEKVFQLHAEGEIPTTQAVFYLVQSYDCLSACPEWEQVDDERKSELQQLIQETITRFLLPTPDNLTISASIQYQSTRLYAATVSGATQIFNRAVKGNGDLAGLETILRTGLTSEGLILDAPMENHMLLSAELLTAGAALKSASPDAFEGLSPWIQKTADVITYLSYPSGNLPTMLGPVNPALMAPMLERAFRLYGYPEYAELLRHVYKSEARQGEHLLLGTINLEDTLPAEHHTTALPQTGAVLLHNSADDPFSAYVDTGLLSRRTKQDALLALELRTKAGGLSVPQKEMGTSGYNTVLVNRKPHTPQNVESQSAANGFLYALKTFSDQSAYIDTAAYGQYKERSAYGEESNIQPPVNYFQRTMYLCDHFLIDLFRVRGGQMHDYVYHARGSIKSASNVELQSTMPDADDLPIITNAQSLQQARAKGIYNLQFQSIDPQTYSERIWFIDPAGSQLITGGIDDQTFLTSRRIMEEGESNLYSVIHEVLPNDQTSNTRIISLSLEPQPNKRDFQAVAFAIESGDRVNIILSSTNPTVEYTTDYEGDHIVFKGRFAHIRKLNDEFKSLRLIGGSFLRIGTHGVDVEENMQVGIVSNVLPEDGALRIDFPHPLSVEDQLLGHSFFAATPNRGPSVFQPFVIERLENKQSPQIVYLQHHPNLIDPPSALGAPVQTGDQVIYEHYAEMVRLNQDRFRLHYSSPMDVIVEGGPKRNRVMVQSTRITERIRGGSTVGVILFSVDPNERIEGKVEFSRIP